jgi:predicted metal-dependent hydrolase
MKLSFRYGTKTVDFSVTYRERKTIEISVEPPDIVTVVAPIDTPDDIIIQKVKSKASWIVQQIYDFKDTKYIHIKKEFVNGESFMYLGRNYSLQINIDGNKESEVKLYQGKFYITIKENNEALIEKAMMKWYKEKALEKITQRVKYYQSYFNKKPTNIKVKEQHKRWGSCTAKNELLFNWKCIMAPSPILDYIVVHEMCHMYEKNHSQKFWDMIFSVLPDYERRKEWLKNNGVRMSL